jgi:RNA polymerase sigma-70 factor (ECF subfamily)
MGFSMFFEKAPDAPPDGLPHHRGDEPFRSGGLRTGTLPRALERSAKRFPFRGVADHGMMQTNGGENNTAGPGPVLATMTPAPDRRFRELFLAHATDLRAFVGSLVRSRGVREDVVLEVAQTLWDHFDSFEPTRSFGAWARSVAANKILHHQRMDPSFPARLSPEATLAVAEAWEEAEARDGVCGSAEQLEILTACLRALPERAARLAQWRYAEGRSVHDIASQSGSTPESVHQSLGRLRIRLAACLCGRVDASAEAAAPPTGLIR